MFHFELWWSSPSPMSYHYPKIKQQNWISLDCEAFTLVLLIENEYWKCKMFNLIRINLQPQMIKRQKTSLVHFRFWVFYPYFKNKLSTGLVFVLIHTKFWAFKNSIYLSTIFIPRANKIPLFENHWNPSHLSVCSPFSQVYELKVQLCTVYPNRKYTY